MNYPLLSEYEIAIKNGGNSILNLNTYFEFIPHRTLPIKFYNFGSGSFATVFKIKNQQNNSFALRCFLNGADQKKIERSEQIINYLSKINETWLSSCNLFAKGIKVKDHYFSVILMQWIEGKTINTYVSEILNFNHKIEDLQINLVKLSDNLEKNGIAHGDIQSANILVEKHNNDITLKLVDYDAMYVPTLKGHKAYETGHSSFQHQNRSKDFFNEKIDRFSFWLMLTALEALKFDKELWNKDMKGGFNDEDNFLFRAKDIAFPNDSPLIKRLKNLRQPSVDFYLNNLLLNHSSPEREKVKLFASKNSNEEIFNDKKKEITIPSSKTKPIISNFDEFSINSNVPNANVFLSSVRGLKLGITPIKLDSTYASKLIIIEKNGKQKALYINNNVKDYFINLEETEKKFIQKNSKYQIFDNRGLKIDVSVKDIEELFKSGHDINTIFVDGTIQYVANNPEIKEIKDKYYQKPITSIQNNQTEKTNIINHPAETKNTENNGIKILDIIIIIFIAVMFYVISRIM